MNREILKSTAVAHKWSTLTFDHAVWSRNFSFNLFVAETERSLSLAYESYFFGLILILAGIEVFPKGKAKARRKNINLRGSLWKASVIFGRFQSKSEGIYKFY